MRIQNVESPKFAGYDARPLKGFYMGSNTHNIAMEMQKIGKREGFKVFSKLTNGTFAACEEMNPKRMIYSYDDLWAQDIWTFLPQKLLTKIKQKDARPICNYFNISLDENNKHLSGGNMFIINMGDKDQIFVGEAELDKFSLQEIKERYDSDFVHVLPQMDYHLDLFIRPLDEKRVLVADDSYTIRVLEKGLDEFKQYIKNNWMERTSVAKTIISNFEVAIANFKSQIELNKLPQTEDIVKKLKMSGVTPIRVPGRIYNTNFYDGYGTFLTHQCNYINASVLKNKDDDIVYITNKSDIDDALMLNTFITKNFKFRFQDEFVKSLSPFVKPEKVYFINGDNGYISTSMLPELQGGIHCVCTEIPVEVGKSYE